MPRNHPDADISGEVPAPPDPAGLFSQGGGVIKLRIEGSLTIPKPGVIRV